MKPIDFEVSNRRLVVSPGAADAMKQQGHESGDLHVFQGDGESVSCWRLSWWDRLAVIITGRVWLRVWGSQPPVSVTTQYPFVSGQSRADKWLSSKLGATS